MSFLSRLFGSRSGSTSKDSRDIDAELERLEREAKSAAPGYVGSAYNKAGDLALRVGRGDRALGYYGRAIDAFLEDAQREAARGVANKIIRVRPSAVRTLCTLTWLDLAAQHQATALLHLRDYVESAKEAGQRVRAATQIHAMARLSTDPEFIEAVADALDGLDFPRRASEVRAWSSRGAPDAARDDDALAEACLRGAVSSSSRDEALLRDEDAQVPDEGAAGARREHGASPAESGGDLDASDADAEEEPTDAEAAPTTGSGGTHNGAQGAQKARKSKKKKRYRWD